MFVVISIGAIAITFAIKRDVMIETQPCFNTTIKPPCCIKHSKMVNCQFVLPTVVTILSLILIIILYILILIIKYCPPPDKK